MKRVHLRFVRPGMTLARAVTAADGTVVAGVGSRLGPPAVRLLVALGVGSVWVESPGAIAPWEEDPELEEALARLDARFAGEPHDAVLHELHGCLHERLVAHAARRQGDGS